MLKKGIDAVDDTPKMIVAGRVLSIVGGAMSAYGEYNSTNGGRAKTAAVGVADIGSNLASVYAGVAIGSFVGPEGTVAGAVIRAGVSLVASGAISYFGDNIANHIINLF